MNQKSNFTLLKIVLQSHLYFFSPVLAGILAIFPRVSNYLHVSESKLSFCSAQATIELLSRGYNISCVDVTKQIDQRLCFLYCIVQLSCSLFVEESVPSCNPMREIEISFICGAGAGIEDEGNTNTNKLRTFEHSSTLHLTHGSYPFCILNWTLVVFL